MQRRGTRKRGRGKPHAGIGQLCGCNSLLIRITALYRRSSNAEVGGALASEAGASPMPTAFPLGWGGSCGTAVGTRYSRCGRQSGTGEAQRG
jgi:hypothetical protein